MFRTNFVVFGGMTKSFILPNKKKNPTNFLIEFLAEREELRFEPIWKL